MRFPTIKRRTLLISGGAIAVLGLLGIGKVSTADPRAYLKQVLVMHLDDIPVEEKALDAAVDEYWSLSNGSQKNKISQIAKMASLIGASNLDKLLSGWMTYDGFRRRVVTFFLVNSSYFYRSSKAEMVTYSGRNRVCQNPFARFL